MGRSIPEKRKTPYAAVTKFYRDTLEELDLTAIHFFQHTNLLINIVLYLMARILLKKSSAAFGRFARSFVRREFP